jgi:hypothetical protein
LALNAWRVKYLDYSIGILLLFLAAVLAINFYENFSNKPLLQLLNLIAAIGFGLYYLFLKKKKHIIVEGQKLIIKKGSRQIKQLDLSSTERVVKGYSQMKIIFNNQLVERFKFSDFDPQSVVVLKSL